MAAVFEKKAEIVQRQEAARAASLDREDLYLLMESYQNTIALNTTLLERQEILNANIERVIKELIAICGNQAKTLEELRGFKTAAHDDSEKAKAAAHDDNEKILAALDAGRLAEVKEHSAHNNRIYIALAGMISIILALIGLLVKVWPK